MVIFNAIMALNAFFIALISLLGVILKSDTIGRIVFSATWFLVGSWWVSRLFQTLKNK
jgi:hypothetical protein